MDKPFFQVVSVARFTELLADFSPLPLENIPLEHAHGRFVGQSITAPENLPQRGRSGMDGYAVRAADVFGASEGNPAYIELAQELDIQEISTTPLAPLTCARIVTGGSLPPGADAVVMVEHTEDLGAGTIEMRKSPAPGDNVMLPGEDVRQGDEALEAGMRLTPARIGLLAALGITHVTVGTKPVVGILSTGDELVPIDQTPPPGHIRDVNTHALSCMITEAGGIPRAYGLVPDNLSALTASLQQAVKECDVILLSGGSSIGVRDFTLDAIKSCSDAEILAHGIAVSPGKPTILGRIAGKAILGLPGQVTSAQVVFFIFVTPFIQSLAGRHDALTAQRPSIRAIMARNVFSKPGRQDYVRVRLEAQPNALPKAHPILGKSGLLKTMLAAEGLVVIDAENEGLDADIEVDVMML
ncbi:gephyrin-like molybdotransferase Glp [Desulfovibrio inopinatus]|uniref:molybdopterin molybdotransferase MoeA n=1 Tax=Desulfovibrio inopinatus TaxID=102109 RepID=UPI0003FD3758|nr:gephyrin-like molybdotransferase Glp [Desulfovibrio inopinatus]